MRPRPQNLRILVALQSIAIIALLSWGLPRYVAAAADAHPRTHQSHTATNAIKGAAATPNMSQARVVLWGDSLSVESQSYFRQALRRHGISNVLTRAWGGTAVCDWLADMRNIATTWHPTLAVLVFNGNTLTPCARRAPRLTEYSQDLDTAISILRTAGVRVVLASTPPGRNTPATRDGLSEVGLLFQDAAIRDHLAFIAAGSAVLANNRYADYLPCLPTEHACVAFGVEQVRSPDGLHFCPRPRVVHWSPECPVYSSGAYRFGSALAEGAARAIATNSAARVHPSGLQLVHRQADSR